MGKKECYSYILHFLEGNFRDLELEAGKSPVQYFFQKNAKKEPIEDFFTKDQ